MSWLNDGSGCCLLADTVGEKHMEEMRAAHRLISLSIYLRTLGLIVQLRRRNYPTGTARLCNRDVVIPELGRAADSRMGRPV